MKPKLWVHMERGLQTTSTSFVTRLKPRIRHLAIKNYHSRIHLLVGLGTTRPDTMIISLASKYVYAPTRRKSTVVPVAGNLQPSISVISFGFFNIAIVYEGFAIKLNSTRLDLKSSTAYILGLRHPREKITVDEIFLPRKELNRSEILLEGRNSSSACSMTLVPAKNN